MLQEALLDARASKEQLGKIEAELRRCEGEVAKEKETAAGAVIPAC